MPLVTSVILSSESPVSIILSVSFIILYFQSICSIMEEDQDKYGCLGWCLLRHSIPKEE